MNPQRGGAHNPGDDTVVEAAEALREVGWVFTLGALPLLLMALHPSLFESYLLSQLPGYSIDVQPRFFMLGVIVLLIGVTQYLWSLYIQFASRRRDR